MPRDARDVDLTGDIRRDFHFFDFDPVPSGVTIGPARDFGFGVLVIYWMDPVQLDMSGPTGCRAEWVLLNPLGIAVRGNNLDLNGDGTPDGAMIEDAPGHYSGVIDPTPRSTPTVHGYHKVVITLHCASADVVAAFDIYIDPSPISSSRSTVRASR